MALALISLEILYFMVVVVRLSMLHLKVTTLALYKVSLALVVEEHLLLLLTKVALLEMLLLILVVVVVLATPQLTMLTVELVAQEL
jgi:hypothetical protein